jgi:hypothetical protein
MNNRKIKVVKRDVLVPEAAVEEERQPDVTERGMTNAVKDWIDERRKNSQAEAASNAHKFKRLNKRLKLSRNHI